MWLKGKRLGYTVGILVLLVVVGGLLRSFVWQPYKISSSSMEPTLLSGDRIIVNRLAYRGGNPSRGDLVVFNFPMDLQRTFVKRVIALPGETVELKDNQVFVNGKVVAEPYLKQGDYPPFGPEIVPQGKVFVLGDNRRESGDSREWGLLPDQNILGKCWLIYYPLNRWRGL